MTDTTAETAPAAMTPAERMAKARAARGQAKTADTAPATVPEGLVTSNSVDDAAVRAQIQRMAAEEAALSVEPQDGPTNNVRVATAQAAEQASRERAARQRLAQANAGPEPTVRVRITKAGDGRVSMGQHFAGVGEAHYEWKEVTEPLPLSVAKALEDRGFAEIED